MASRVAKVETELGDKLKTAEKGWREAERKLIEFTGTAEEVERAHQERLEEQKRERIDHLHRQVGAGRRSPQPASRMTSRLRRSALSARRTAASHAR